MWDIFLFKTVLLQTSDQVSDSVGGLDKNYRYVFILSAAVLSFSFYLRQRKQGKH